MDFFSPWEGDPISSWAEALAAIEDVLTRTGERRTVAWRGQINARWSLHSGLYRRLLYARQPGQEAPKEDDLLRAEQRIVDTIRAQWRFDQMPYLELMANLQHYRGPTRMLDVSLSPLVALWFAVEQQHDENDDEDGRLFAFDVTNRRVNLDHQWNTYDIPWREHGKGTPWCRELPLLWRPPSYNERIPAQQSGFLLAGVPKFHAGKTRSTGGNQAAPGNYGKLMRFVGLRRFPPAWLIAPVPSRTVRSQR